MSEIKMSVGVLSLQRLQGRILPCLSPLLVVPSVPWLVAVIILISVSDLRSLSPLCLVSLSSPRALAIRFRAYPNTGAPPLKIFNLIPSAKTLFQNKVISTSSRGTYLAGGAPLNPLHIPQSAPCVALECAELASWSWINRTVAWPQRTVLMKTTGGEGKVSGYDEISTKWLC